MTETDPSTPFAITDEMVEAALAVWYPGEWPDNPVFRDAPHFAAKVRDEMRAALTAALSLQPQASALEKALGAVVEAYEAGRKDGAAPKPDARTGYCEHGWRYIDGCTICSGSSAGKKEGRG